MTQWGQNAAFSSRSLPMNTVILFVPQQEAWVVERFGKFNRILEPVSIICFRFIAQLLLRLHIENLLKFHYIYN